MTADVIALAGRRPDPTEGTNPEDCIDDPEGGEDPCVVFVSNSVARSICIDWKVDLSVEQARAVAYRLLELADSAS